MAVNSTGGIERRDDERRLTSRNATERRLSSPSATAVEQPPTEPVDGRTGGPAPSHDQPGLLKHVRHLFHHPDNCPADKACPGEDAQFQKKRRLITDGALLGLSDMPSLFAIGACFGWIPGMSHFLSWILALNALSGAGSIASDASVARDCVTNKDAKTSDKVVDCVHLANDFVNTGAGMAPMFMAMHGPLSVVGLVFIGGQVGGTLIDVGKMLWDYHRGGQQSAHEDGDSPIKMVMDTFEKKMAQIPIMAAAIGSEQMLFPALAGNIPGVVASSLVSFGGGFGAIYGLTQVKKARRMLGVLDDLKKQGVETFDLPSYKKGVASTKTMDVDKAIKTVKRHKLEGYGQIAASTVLMAAGCFGFPPLVIAGMAASAAVGIAAVGAEAYAHREEIAAALQPLVERMQTVVSKVGDKAQGVVSTVGDKAHDVVDKVKSKATRKGRADSDPAVEDVVGSSAE